ncbi:hypothetical protein F511_22869 [Dorcoceras hygrometricum]|uniref:Uncharacterized protein n=1 Tax=Dorcoceras hygrometricum TaxID=472368 RepID=A0A2Z7AWW2_9LAMI|nr:hypothetical protein F511_22869 [Dorcoceras hygrometricum]
MGWVTSISQPLGKLGSAHLILSAAEARPRSKSDSPCLPSHRWFTFPSLGVYLAGDQNNSSSTLRARSMARLMVRGPWVLSLNRNSSRSPLRK